MTVNRLKMLAASVAMLATTLLGATSTAHADTATCRPSGQPNICATWRYRLAVARLSARPALIKPGAWQAPAGPALVQECLESYPNVRRGPANAELMSCLRQPDPRLSDRSVMTLHQHHINHVNHANRQR